MSPLIDVTNTVVPDIPDNVRFPLTKSASNEPKKVEDVNPAAKEESQITKDDHPSTKCNNPRQKRGYNKRHRKKSSLKTLQVNSPNPLAQNFSNDSRVPPIPSEDLLNQAFQSLNLSTEKLKEGNLPHQQNNNLQEKNVNCTEYRLTGSSNNVGPTSESVTSAYQCIACGLELSSIETLTQHLVKHIYEGLHAASWLNNAISTLLFPYSTDTTSENNLPKAPPCTALPSSTVNGDNSLPVKERHNV